MNVGGIWSLTRSDGMSVHLNVRQFEDGGTQLLGTASISWSVKKDKSPFQRQMDYAERLTPPPQVRVEGTVNAESITLKIDSPRGPIAFQGWRLPIGLLAGICIVPRTPTPSGPRTVIVEGRPVLVEGGKGDPRTHVRLTWFSKEEFAA
jgi:hypothetical protein